MSETKDLDPSLEEALANLARGISLRGFNLSDGLRSDEFKNAVHDNENAVEIDGVRLVQNRSVYQVDGSDVVRTNLWAVPQIRQIFEPFLLSRKGSMFEPFAHVGNDTFRLLHEFSVVAYEKDPKAFKALQLNAYKFAESGAIVSNNCAQDIQASGLQFMHAWIDGPWGGVENGYPGPASDYKSWGAYELMFRTRNGMIMSVQRYVGTLLALGIVSHSVFIKAPNDAKFDYFWIPEGFRLYEFPILSTKGEKRHVYKIVVYSIFNYDNSSTMISSALGKRGSREEEEPSSVTESSG
jgi:hypothetical protein